MSSYAMTIYLRIFTISMKREKEEFAYLQDKLNGESSDATSESQELTEDYGKTSANASIPPYNSRSRSERYQKINSLPKKKN